MDIKYLILIANVIFCLVSSLALSAYVRNHDTNKRPACLISCIYFAFFAAVSATVYFLPRFYDFTTTSMPGILFCPLRHLCCWRQFH